MSETLCFSISERAAFASHLYINTIFLAVTNDKRKTACEPVTWNKGTAASVQGFSPATGDACGTPSTSIDAAS